ncbi:hypothetical protein CP061683_0406B, partial [Chlamydia psittaci 06-1683]
MHPRFSLISENFSLSSAIARRVFAIGWGCLFSTISSTSS